MSLVPVLDVQNDPAVGSSHVSPPGFKLIGDNVDKNIRARYQRYESDHNESIHFFHLCAFQDRIDFSHLVDYHPDNCPNSLEKRAAALLPTAEDDIALYKNFKIRLSCLLVSNMKFFRTTFDGVVQRHIEHKYSKEMASKSTVVSARKFVSI